MERIDYPAGADPQSFAVTPETLLRNPYRLTHPSYCSVENGTVNYTQEGLRFYSDLFREHGLPLPLPADESTLSDALWKVLDDKIEAFGAELERDRPAMPAGEKALADGWLTGNSAVRRAAAAAIESANIERAQLAEAGPNVAGLAVARIHRKRG